MKKKHKIFHKLSAHFSKTNIKAYWKLLIYATVPAILLGFIIRFYDINYISLKFLERLTNLMEPDTKLSLERIEFSSDRFSMNGAIDSYENLQKLKSKLQIFPEFEEKRIIESNRKSQEGILYRITVDL